MSIRSLSLCVALLAGAVPASGQAEVPDTAGLLRLARSADDAVHWMLDPFELVDQRRGAGRAQPYSPPIDRGALLDLALRRAGERGQLLLVYVYRIEGRHMYRAPLLDDAMRLAVWADPETAELVRRRFVPLRLYVDRHVAPRLGVQLGGREQEGFLQIVEPALIFVAPSGEVVHVVERIRTFSPYWVRSVLQRVLARNPEHASPSPGFAVLQRDAMRTGEGRARLADELCLEGREREALALLREPHEEAPKDRAVQALRRAELRALRLCGRGASALHEEFEAGSCALEGLRSAIACNAHERATALLSHVPPSSERAFWTGYLHWRAWELDAARASFAEAVRLAEAPFAGRAAAMLVHGDDTTPISPLAHGIELASYPAAATLTGPPPRTTELPARGPEATLEVARAALAWLLAEQRPDGSWSDTRYAYWGSPEILPNVRVAISALAATALLRWRELAPERVDAALRRAEGYLLEDRALALGKNEEIYAQAYRMLYWSRRLPHLGGEAAARTRARLATWARRAAAIQNPDSGFFAHEYENAFCTGAMLWSLHALIANGIEVHEDTVRLGLRALQSARRADGSFRYGGALRREEKGSISTARNASGRMPLCEGVLHAFGASDDAALERAFVVFLEHLPALERVRKCDFHSDGELGGFFFWHSVFHASEAAVRLQAPRRAELRARLLELVHGIQEIDGSFVDSHELGKSYGTAMALLTLGGLHEMQSAEGDGR